MSHSPTKIMSIQVFLSRSTTVFCDDWLLILFKLNSPSNLFFSSLVLWWEGPVLTNFSETSSMMLERKRVSELQVSSMSAFKSPMITLWLNSEDKDRKIWISCLSDLMETSGGLYTKPIKVGEEFPSQTVQKMYSGFNGLIVCSVDD